ncbi:CAP domain-containing protein [Georgenia phoenicis]|uniref:CAP domain-containing protein n=1 Tax=unclassified Georgenia TaxID=2626815 RepID=UPI0039B012EF
MRTHRTVVAAALTAALLAVGAPATAKGGEVGGEGSMYYLSDGWAGRTDRAFAYGRAGDRVYVGDWDGNGSDTLAVRRGSTYYFTNTLTGGAAQRVVAYGRLGDTVLMGDWDGDGVDTPVVRRGSVYHFKNSLSGGAADRVVGYGRPGDQVIVGDWDGDGVDTLGVRRGQVYHLKNSLRGGAADVVVGYGRPGDQVIVGDWNGDGTDSLGVRRGNTYYVKNTISAGAADRVTAFGRAGDAVLVGDWNGDRSTTLGVRRDAPAQQPPAQGGLTAYDERMFRLVNAERAAAGVAPMQLSTGLRAGALRHSEWMARTGELEHASADTIRADARAAGCVAAAENIFYGSPGYANDPDAAVEAYMNSAGHRANILNPAHRYFAAGTTQAANGDVYNTQRFASSC